jgi:uncharacterized membrane protein YbhN (UPF0104 family)
MKSWYKYFVYISLVFLAVALYNANFLKVPKIFSISSLIASFIFLFAGFIINAITWQKVLKESNYSVDLSSCIAGVGLSIFGKYIPGKIWMVMGRAAYITETFHHSLGTLSAVSLNAQFIAIWFGLVFGVIGLFLLGGFHLWGWLILFLWVGLAVIIFSELAHEHAERAIKSLLRKDITLPRFTIKSTISVMPWFVSYWGFWSFGFYLLVTSLIKMDVPWGVGFGFPLAGTLGIMTLISPGGLGTREAVLVGYLNLAGIPVVDATTIAVASRLWFLGGEIFIFILGWISHKRLPEVIQKKVFGS